MTSLPSPGSPVKSLSGAGWRFVKVISSNTNPPKHPLVNSEWWDTINSHVMREAWTTKCSAFSVLQLWVSQGSTDTGKDCLLPATVSKASPLEGSLSPQAFVKSFEVTESLGRKRSDRKPLRSQRHYFYLLWCCIFFCVFHWCLDQWVVWMKDEDSLRNVHHLQTYHRFHEARTLKSLKKHKMIPKKHELFLLWWTWPCYFDFDIYYMYYVFDLFDFSLGLFWFPPSTRRANVPGRHLLLRHPRKHSCPRCLSSGASRNFMVAKQESWGGLNDPKFFHFFFQMSCLLVFHIIPKHQLVPERIWD